MQQTLLIIHVVFGLLFILAVLVQDKGTGLSSTFGGSGGFYASQRGAAKVVHYLSMIFCALFFASALVYVVLPSDPVEPSVTATGGDTPIQITPEAVQ